MIAIAILVSGNARQIPSTASGVYNASPYASGISNMNIEIIPKTIAIIVFPAALNTPVNANCIPINPREKDKILKKSDQILITSLFASVFSIKSPMSSGAKIAIKTPNPLKIPKEISALTFAMC